MKKIFKISFVIFVLFSLTACKNNINKEENNYEQAKQELKVAVEEAAKSFINVYNIGVSGYELSIDYDIPEDIEYYRQQVNETVEQYNRLKQEKFYVFDGNIPKELDIELKTIK